MTCEIHRATLRDRDSLLQLMSAFYAEAGYPLNTDRAAVAFRELLSDDSLGRAWLIFASGEIVGYLVITLGFSMEYGGRDAFVDDLFVRPEYRGKGLGTIALAKGCAVCAELGVRALHLEVERGNAAAQALYRRAGFVDNDRQLLSLRLADRMHIT